MIPVSERRLSPFDPETEYGIEESETPPSVDGYARGEPKFLVCEGHPQCNARVQLTEEPSPGIDDLGHHPECPNRFAKTDFWRSQFW